MTSFTVVIKNENIYTWITQLKSVELRTEKLKIATDRAKNAYIGTPRISPHVQIDSHERCVKVQVTSQRAIPAEEIYIFARDLTTQLHAILKPLKPPRYDAAWRQ